MKWSLVFSVMLDGHEVGNHSFALHERGGERELVSEAAFAVRFAGITFFRYRHEAAERWRGDCLESLTARTERNGEQVAVDWRSPPGCTMSFAYWNPKILDQKALLDPQTGRLEPVSVTALGAETLEVRGQKLATQRYRLANREGAIDVWYAGASWVALEATVAGGRKLRYRLESGS